VIIDCHGHFTTAPATLGEYRRALLDWAGTGGRPPSAPVFGDGEVRDALEGSQVRLQRARGIDLVLFSPRASAMAHHEGGLAVGVPWSRACNDLVAQAAALFPERFAPVCQLPQAPGAPLDAAVAELRRCVEELGFVACNLNPDPSGGRWSEPPLGDPWWYPLYEAMVELDVPAMVHVSASASPAVHATGGYYLAADTIVFMQLLLSGVFERFPTLRFVIPHGGGAVPFHWGRFRGLALDAKRPDPEESLLGNVFFDTCVYHQPGIDLLLEVIPARNVLFGSEMVGAVRGVDPASGEAFDDTRRYVERSGVIGDEERRLIYEENARRVYPRLEARLGSRAEGRV
jgi:4-oxalmesaconate hydratase